VRSADGKKCDTIGYDSLRSGTIALDRRAKPKGVPTPFRREGATSDWMMSKNQHRHHPGKTFRMGGVAPASSPSARIERELPYPFDRPKASEICLSEHMAISHLFGAQRGREQKECADRSQHIVLRA
jgi:hypothetical protein